MKNKIFIVGLPRTVTTSLCAAFLDLGCSVAHTAYTQAAVETAQVIGDAPSFCDFPEFDQLFPGSKFIYLQRDRRSWLLSARGLLERFATELESGRGVINPILLRSYEKIFGSIAEVKMLSDDALLDCYARHEEWVKTYFSQRPEALLCLDLSTLGAFERLGKFLDIKLEGKGFKKLNQNGEITAWKKLKHPLKIDSNLSGPQRRKYYAF